jgi:NADH dehydrogenase
MFVHLLYLVGFRNRTVVVMNWIYNYFTYDRGTRLIVRPFIKNKVGTAQQDSTIVATMHAEAPVPQ